MSLCRIPTWDLITKVGRSRIVSLTILMPIFGYMVIFNEQVVQFFEISRELFNNVEIENNSSVVELSLDTRGRLFFIYFGLTALGLASLFYQLFCPNLVKEHGSEREYIREEVSLMTDKRLSSVAIYLKEKLNRLGRKELGEIGGNFWSDNDQREEGNQKELMQAAAIDLMALQWKYENRSSSIARCFIYLFYALGFLMLATPSIDMFFTVLRAFKG